MLKLFKFLFIILSFNLFINYSFAATDCGFETSAFKASEGWSCMNASDGVNCVTGHCTGSSDIQCCKTKTSGENKVIILGQNIETNSLDGFIQLAVVVAKYILSITGALALLMFVYGGTMMLLSAGTPDKITKAKSILIGAIIGLVIVFTSYTIIGFILQKTGFAKDGSSWATTNFKWAK